MIFDLLKQKQLQSLKQGLATSLSTEFQIQLIQRRDFADIETMLANPKVTEFLYFAPATVEIYRSFFDPIIHNTEQAISKGEWPEQPTFIIRNHCGRFMGMAGLANVMMLPGNYEVGFQLPEHAWGQGIATLACQFCTQLAFTQLDAHKVCGDCYGANSGSAKVLEKSGYRREGCLTGYYKTAQGWDDKLMFGLTQQQFQQRIQSP